MKLPGTTFADYVDSYCNPMSRPLFDYLRPVTRKRFRRKDNLKSCIFTA